MFLPKKKAEKLKLTKPTNMEKITFIGETPFVKPFRSNRDSWRVEIDCGRDSREALKMIEDLLPEKTYKITIEEL